MDRMKDSGSFDTGSTPVGRTIKIRRVYMIQNGSQKLIQVKFKYYAISNEQN